MVWEQTFESEDNGKKWHGNHGYIVLEDPLWILGIRFIIRTDERYIGFT